MRTIKVACAIIACLVLTGAGCASPTPSSDVVISPPPAQPVRVQHSKKIEFRRIVQNIPPGTVIGDWNCGSGKDPVKSDAAIIDMNRGYYAQLFKAAIAPAGYNVLDRADALFDDDASSAAQLQVGASIIQALANGCLPERQVLGVLRPDLVAQFDPTMDMTITVKWQFYDPIARRVIGTTTTMGRAKITENRDTIMQSAMRQAFTQASQAVAADPEFQRVAAGGEEDSNDDGMDWAAAIPTTPIPRLPVSTQPFQPQIPAIEKQVVTVFSAVGNGSGFFIADGLMLTNEHVVGHGKTAKLRFVSGKEVMADVIAVDAKRDVALLKTEPVGLRGLPLRLDNPELGSPVFVIGTPLDQKLSNTLTSGIVSAFRTLHSKNYIQSNANIQHGNSGGPMFDDKGNVIGISDLAREDKGIAVGINFFIPIGEALASVGVMQEAATSDNAAKHTVKHTPAP